MHLTLFALLRGTWPFGDRHRDQRGQATAEYALVLLGAAAVALTLVTWAGGGRVAQFFDAVFNHLMEAAK
ncbi:MAG: hypothetical protein QOG64_1239 [Acidimicrobiaceae bacterium]|jgi:Flp pilus assembly pilin Flp|nr:hypothetical protein [Acidimicrobiaceae bacterium]